LGKPNKLSEEYLLFCSIIYLFIFKSFYKVGFIREKGKAIAREVQWSPEAGSSLLR
jgi:hypothetical protein